jgi:uncharacterized protein YbjQ (UPF0145 family)
MKHSFKFSTLIIIVLFLSSCATSLQQWDSEYRTFGYDFTEYSESGFLFTPEGYNGNYDSVGMIEVVFIPQIRKGNERINIEGAYRIVVGTNYYYVKEPDTDEIIMQMYKKAIELGADALINFELVPHLLDNEGVKIATYRVGGFAIKRH